MAINNNDVDNLLNDTSNILEKNQLNEVKIKKELSFYQMICKLLHGVINNYIKLFIRLTYTLI